MSGMGVGPLPEGLQTGVMATVDPVIHQPQQPPGRRFLDHPWVVSILPYVTSVAFHGGILLFAYLTYQAITDRQPVTQEQVIIPDATVIENGVVGGTPNPGELKDPNRAAAQDDIADASPSELGKSTSNKLNQAMMGGAEDAPTDGIIGIGAANSFARGKGKEANLGEGDGGGMAPFGAPGGGSGNGPRVNFVGVSSNARNIVFLCDASGSMMTVMTDLKRELNKTITGLSPVQSFGVIFFAGDAKPMVFKPQLVMANPDNKKTSRVWVGDMSAFGNTNPLPAIRQAFALQPDLIFVLTDGFDNADSLDAIAKEFQRLNVKNRVKVNTILIKSSEEEELVKVLQRIARENGGVFKQVDQSSF